MAVVRVCTIFVLLLINQVSAKPFFGYLLCDYLCDDDETSASATSDSWDDYIEDWCDCEPPNKTTPAPPASPASDMRASGTNPQTIRLKVGSAREILINYGSDGMLINLPDASDTTAAPGSSTPAGSTTPAPAASTAATTAAATTAAGSSAATTAAPTTAAA